MGEEGAVRPFFFPILLLMPLGMAKGLALSARERLDSGDTDENVMEKGRDGKEMEVFVRL